MPDQDPGQNPQVDAPTTPAMPTETKPEEVTEPTLPEEVSARTKEEFEKLKAHNKELAEKLAKHENPPAPKPSLLDDIYPSIPAQSYQSLPPQQVNQIAQQYVDKDGYVDVNALNNALALANDSAKRAIAEAQQAKQQVERYEHTQNVKKAYELYPTLDPDNAEFDADFYNIVRNEIYGQMIKGKPTNIYEAAQKMGALLQSKTKSVEAKKEKEQVAKETIAKRDIVSAQAGGNKGTQPAVNQDELIDKSRQGDRNAIFKRLQQSGY